MTDRLTNEELRLISSEANPPNDIGPGTRLLLAKACSELIPARKRLVAAEVLRDGADHLAGEIMGCWGMAEEELRRILGNTNYNVIQDWAEKVKRSMEVFDAAMKEDER